MVIIKKNIIDKFIDFINAYNSEEIGEARATETPENIIIFLWNAG